MSTNNMCIDFSKYKAAQDAADSFTRELERVYGKRNACNARYQYTHADLIVAAAAEAKKAADVVWLEEMRK